MKLISTLIGLLTCCLLNAQNAGTLDSSFGVNSIVISNFGTGNDAFIYGAAMQPDDKIISVGNFGFSSPESEGFIALRYTVNGVFDNNFADSGKALIPFEHLDYTQSNSAAIQIDGKILIVGYGWINYFNPTYYGIILRLNTNGSIDSAFGKDGSVMVKNASYESIALQSDNKIIIGGTTNNLASLTRFYQDGSIDNTFGINGTITAGQYFFQATCKIQNDSKIVTGGFFNQTGLKKFYLQRYNKSGKPDESFGNEGTVFTDYGPNGCSINDLAFQSDNKIVVVGTTNNQNPTNTYMAIARYNQNGSLDSSFGNEGKATILFSNATSNAKSIIISNSDKIVVGGWTLLNKSSLGDYIIIKLKKEGIKDSSFGTDGQVITDLGYGDGIVKVMFQQSGKIVAAGESANNFVNNASLARYNNDDLSKKQIIIKKIKHYAATHTNVQATSLNNVSIYPNPAQNVLHVAGLSSKAKLTVVDVEGNIKLQAIANASSYNLNIASLNAGSYLLKIEMNNAVVTKQFIKQ